MIFRNDFMTLGCAKVILKFVEFANGRKFVDAYEWVATNKDVCEGKKIAESIRASIPKGMPLVDRKKAKGQIPIFCCPEVWASVKKHFNTNPNCDGVVLLPPREIIELANKIVLSRTLFQLAGISICAWVIATISASVFFDYESFLIDMVVVMTAGGTMVKPTARYCQIVNRAREQFYASDVMWDQ